MTKFNEVEVKLFSKYWGADHLEDNDEFWEDAYNLHKETAINVPVPLGLDAFSIRYAGDLFVCPSGGCADCCRFKRVSVRERDVLRIVENTEYSMDDVEGMLGANDNGRFLKAEGGCPFLKDKVCTIYAYRPDICWLFPLQSNTDNQMLVRLLCRPALDLVRKLITDSVRANGTLLLPNLNIIPTFKES